MSPLTGRTPPVSLKFFLSFLFLFSAFSTTVITQEGTSTAAPARSRYLAESGLLPASREVAVDEFVNYHRHQIIGHHR